MIIFHNLADTSDEQTLAWLAHIAANLRPSDWDEMRATNPLLTLGDPDPLVLLTASLMMSRFAWVICRDGEPFCIFGAAPDDKNDGIIWMLGTPGMESRTARYAVARHTQSYVADLLEEWPRLYNYIDARNSQSLQWLLWSGFQIEAVDLHHGREQRPFYLFSISREGPSDL
ncbi:hypothetical protein [Brevundimonas diminuta]|uniref:hypothetical protein n=1 Tax=Brevundimonas diminuta TaxID=293 RepID=UPI001378E47C|nr:hypothetical protein [Brevundimonas diminuta]